MKLVDWDEMKDFGPGDQRALYSRLGGMEVVRAINADRITVLLAKPATADEVGEVVLEEAIKPFFDSTGRRIPPTGMKAKVADANRGFYLQQPKLDYADRLSRTQKHFDIPQPLMSADEFEGRCVAVMERIATDPTLVNLLIGGIVLPLCIPQTETSRDYGALLEEQLLPVVERAYKEQFSERNFVNYRKGDLAGKVKVVEKTHQVLLDVLYRGPVAGLYFPNCLQGFSVPAAREQMASLPSDCLLVGAIEPATALVAYPDVLTRDYETPGLDCSAVQWQSQEHSLYFLANDDGLWFDCRNLAASDFYSSGLFFLG